ncbi:MAG: efflux RND transporter permease subunit [Sandaracinus sp.]|nr:efflux RND transporter permease subunit [Sandaracinus sp.]MCB9631035.1 efflux RND transporter permease subunit [Sandaracinus sp.]
MSEGDETGSAGRLARAFIDNKLTPVLIASAVALGALAVQLLPREEEPQIEVPMVDIFVALPGASAREVEQRVSAPIERLVQEVPGVEYVYSTSSPARSLIIARFEVGSSEENAILRVHDRLAAYADRLPADATEPVIRPRFIDDVPVLAVTMFSERYDGTELRRIAEEVRAEVKQVPDVTDVQLLGGESRQVRVLLDPEELTSRGLTALAVVRALGSQNARVPSGSVVGDGVEVLVETGTVLANAEDVESVVIGAWQGRPVYVRDVARVVDGGEEPGSYVRFGAGAAAEHDPVARSAGRSEWPAITLAVSKREGTNAVDVVRRVMARLESLQGSIVPEEVHLSVTRDYGESASEKSDELLLHMGIAVLGVALLILLALGRREAVIVMLAIPATLALTLTVFFLYGYTLNRITLFALIFSIGILVDDAIVVVENIARHYRLPENRGKSIVQIAVKATDEVGNPTILATMTVIAAILPMAFVGGLMGPYMRPIPVGAAAAMIFSLVVAFAVTPWASIRLLARGGGGHGHGGGDGHGGGHGPEQEGASTRAYRRFVGHLIRSRRARWTFLFGTQALLLGSLALVATGWVKVKMLPFDNKSEFQVVLDMPEGTPLEETARVTQELADVVRRREEVVSYQSYVGTSGPITFNGLVRHYYLRQGSHVADIVVNLLPKHDRDAQSHEIARALRDELHAVAERHGGTLQVTEVPPGPPVLQTLVAEIYGPDYERQIEIAERIAGEMRGVDGIVDVDVFTEASQRERRYVVDDEKAAMHGLSEAEIARTLRLAIAGEDAGRLHDERMPADVPVRVQLDRATRSDPDRLLAMPMVAADGRTVPLRELVRVEEGVQERSIYHKNLMPVVYVTGDVAGAIESPVYAMLQLGPALDALELPEGYALEQHTASAPEDTSRFSVKWDGEWHITYEVFRDLGVAFAIVLVLIYVLVLAWFRSYLVPIVIMSAIPYSLVGILPAHGLMDAFFSATSMIGFIAGAGIVVRNSIILVDFIELRLAEGMPLEEAVVDAGAVRFRPMVLTAAAVIVGAAVILFDPIFQGLAIALMAGEVASLLLSRMTVPLLYYSLRKTQDARAKRRVTTEVDADGHGAAAVAS